MVNPKLELGIEEVFSITSTAHNSVCLITIENDLNPSFPSSSLGTVKHPVICIKKPRLSKPGVYVKTGS